MNEQLSRRQITNEAVNILKGILKPKTLYSSSSNQVQFHCPFHKDNTPSMGIDFTKGIYHCFSCGKGGSIESLYRDLTSENLYDTLGIKNDRFSRYAMNNNDTYNYDKPAVNKTDSIFVNIDWKDFVPFDKNKKSYDYVINRGISYSIAKKYNFMYTENTVINSTSFSDRLIIPIYEKNKLISVEGRRLDGEKEKKVLYPRNCSVSTLFDLDNLNRHETLYVCEGLMDLCVLKSSGPFQNSTSIFGACLTKRQAELLSEFDDVVYIPDLDIAGRDTMTSLYNLGNDRIHYLLLPRRINGVTIKDIGDLPNAGVSVDDLYRRKWLKYIKSIKNFDKDIFTNYLTN